MQPFMHLFNSFSTENNFLALRLQPPILFNSFNMLVCTGAKKRFLGSDLVETVAIGPVLGRFHNPL